MKEGLLFLPSKVQLTRELGLISNIEKDFEDPNYLKKAIE